MSAASNHHTARPVFRSLSVLIADLARLRVRQTAWLIECRSASSVLGGPCLHSLLYADFRFNGPRVVLPRVELA